MQKFDSSITPKSSITYKNYFEAEGLSLWKPMHFEAYKNPQDFNRYFYFFHKADEKLKISGFSSEEKELFLNQLLSLNIQKAVKSSDLKGNWGLFSLLMPYRNGYLCYKNYIEIKRNLKTYEISSIIKKYLKYCDLDTKDNLRKFEDFFNDLEPGYRNTDNQINLLNIMDIDIANIMSKFVSIKRKMIEIDKNFSDTKKHDIKIITNSESLKNFLLEQKTKGIKFKGIEFIEPKKKKPKEESEDITTSKIKKQLKIEEDKSITIIIGKEENSEINKKKSIKRNYSSSKKKQNNQIKSLPYFGFNELLSSEYDSEPNLDHLLSKYLPSKKLRIESDDEYKKKTEKKSINFKNQNFKRLKLFKDEEKIIQNKTKTNFRSRTHFKQKQYEQKLAKFADSILFNKKNKNFFKENRENKEIKIKKIDYLSDDDISIELNNDNSNLDIEIQETKFLKLAKLFKIYKNIDQFKKIFNFNLENISKKETIFLELKFESQNSFETESLSELKMICELLKQIKFFLFTNFNEIELKLSILKNFIKKIKIQKNLEKSVEFSKIMLKIDQILCEIFTNRFFVLENLDFLTKNSILLFYKEFMQIGKLIINVIKCEKLEILFHKILKNNLDYLLMVNFFENEIFFGLENENNLQLEIIQQNVFFLQWTIFPLETNICKELIFLVKNIEKGIEILNEKIKDNNPDFLKYLFKLFKTKNSIAEFENQSFYLRKIGFLMNILGFSMKKEDFITSFRDFSLKKLEINFILAINYLIFESIFSEFSISKVEKITFFDELLINTKYFLSSIDDYFNFLRVYSYYISNFETSHFALLKLKIYEFHENQKSIELITNEEITVKNLFENSFSKNSFEDLSWELHLLYFYEKLLENEKINNNSLEWEKSEKRILSKSLSNLKQFTKLQGDAKTNKEIRIFIQEILFLNFLIQKFNNEDLLYSIFKKTTILVNQLDNSSPLIKEFMLFFSIYFVKKWFEIDFNQKNNLKNWVKNQLDKIKCISEFFLDKIEIVLKEIRELSRFLDTVGIGKIQNLSQNEKKLEKTYNQLKIAIFNAFLMISNNIEKNLIFGLYIAENLVKKQEIMNILNGKEYLIDNYNREILINLLFKINSNEKIESFIENLQEKINPEIFDNEEDYYDKIISQEIEKKECVKIIEDYFKNYKEKEKEIFIKIIELILSIFNKNIQEKITEKHKLTLETLKISFDYLAIISRNLLIKNDFKNLSEKLNPFFDLNSLFFLDNTLKIFSNEVHILFSRSEKLNLTLSFFIIFLKNSNKDKLIEIIPKNQMFFTFMFQTIFFSLFYNTNLNLSDLSYIIQRIKIDKIQNTSQITQNTNIIKLKEWLYLFYMFLSIYDTNKNSLNFLVKNYFFLLKSDKISDDTKRISLKIFEDSLILLIKNLRTQYLASESIEIQLIILENLLQLLLKLLKNKENKLNKIYLEILSFVFCEQPFQNSFIRQNNQISKSYFLRIIIRKNWEKQLFDIVKLGFYIGDGILEGILDNIIGKEIDEIQKNTIGNQLEETWLDKYNQYGEIILKITEKIERLEQKKEGKINILNIYQYILDKKEEKFNKVFSFFIVKKQLDKLLEKNIEGIRIHLKGFYYIFKQIEGFEGFLIAFQDKNNQNKVYESCNLFILIANKILNWLNDYSGL